MKNPRHIHPLNPSHNRPSLENRKSRGLNDMVINNKKIKRKSTMENTNRDQVSQILLTSVSQTSAEKIAGNEDLLSEILVRLPVRSLVRFKCVSKNWLLLISSSHFSHTHSCRNLGSLPVSGLIFSNSIGFDFVGLDGSRPKFSPSLAFMKISNVTVIHSCNGLILCSTSTKTIREVQYLVDYYVCNPTTKKFSSIPPPPFPDDDDDPLCEFGINLVFDPSRSPHFKVVYFTGVMEPHNRHSPDPFTYTTHLYSSNSQSWSSLENPDRTFLRSTILNNGVLCNGSLYWLYPDQWKLIRFEVDEQRFSTITMNVDSNLMGTRYKYDPVHLWQCKGKLYLVQSVFVSNVPADMVVYEMGNVCSEWLVKYIVKFPNEVSGMDAHDNVDGAEDEEVCTCTILAAFGGQKDDDDNDMQLLVKLKYSIREPDVILYGVNEKTATKMLFVDFFYKAYPYIESLSPLF